MLLDHWISNFMAQLLQSPNSGHLQVFFRLGAENAEEPPLSISKVNGNQTIKFMQVGGSLGLWLGLGILQVAYNVEKSFLNSPETGISKTTPTF